ncbi:unnamed protein product [Rotaria sp. Silwood2]|nr:unnamed protein product [Rotaria sp. Silwood2]CAF2924155.1 unnamed protein product [Rotaria sp. Silwood2]CAF3257112.1 unnamed protein product [Rotaria sp. Silwood2]CAF4412875.1 unnamed protein product [Rotaria sp. Silwood2]CAF4425429.1 unnamed protein product [Rotaria sp. Silwood2]
MMTEEYSQDISIPITESSSSAPYTLIWLDTSAKDRSTTQSELSNIVNNELLTFDNAVECQEYIQHMVNKVVLIVSGSMGKQLVPPIHDCSQLLAIYIFCGDKEFHMQWSKVYKKVKSVVVHLDDLIAQILKDYRYYQHVSINVYRASEEKSHTNLQENASFIWLQLFIDIVIRLRSKDVSNGKDELAAYLREKYCHTQSQIDRLDEFQQKYTPEHSIQWYTKDGCICFTLNKALRTADWETLIKYRFFIQNLYRQLQHEQSIQKSSSISPIIHVYRG